METKGNQAPGELVLDVAELLEHPGTTRNFRLDAEIHGLGLGLAHLEPHVHLDVVAASIVEGILLSGTISGMVDIECSRCLTRAERPHTADVSEIFSTEPAADDETYAIDGELADLEPMLRDVMMLDLPLNPLCKPDCKGLCPECGQDLNVADCGHRRDAVDPRWEPLRGLKEAMGE